MEDHELKNFFSKCKDPVIRILSVLRKRRELRRTCREKLDKMNPARLTEILNNDRELSSHYLNLLLQGGVVTIDDILDGRSNSFFTNKEIALLFRLALDDETAILIGRAQQEGVDVKSLFGSIVNRKKVKNLFHYMD